MTKPPEYIERLATRARRCIVAGSIDVQLVTDLVESLERFWSNEERTVDELRKENETLRRTVVLLGGGFDTRGLRGDPRDKRVRERWRHNSVEEEVP